MRQRTWTIMLTLTLALLAPLSSGLRVDPAGDVLRDIPADARIYQWWNGEVYWLANPEPPVGAGVDATPVARELLKPELITDHTPAHPPVEVEMSTAAGFPIQQNGIHAELASDTIDINGLWSTISIAQATNLGSGSFASWPGVTLSNGDFVQVGYATRANPVTGLPQLEVFVQIWKNGYGSHSCTNPGTYVYCYKWTGLIANGQTHAFYFKNGVSGNANRWGFFLNSDANMLTSMVLGATNSGGNTGYALNERNGNPPTATIVGNSWDCGMCQLKNGVWSTPSHVQYAKGGFPQCPPMGFTLLFTNEFVMGSAGGCSYSNGQRVW